LHVIQGWCIKGKLSTHSTCLSLPDFIALVESSFQVRFLSLPNVLPTTLKFITGTTM
jgi:hypothetical protein